MDDWQWDGWRDWTDGGIVESGTAEQQRKTGAMDGTVTLAGWMDRLKRNTAIERCWLEGEIEH